MAKQNILIEIAKAAADNVSKKEFNDEHKFNEKEIEDVLETALKDEKVQSEIKSTLYPKGVTVTDDFFEKMNELYVLCGFNDKSRILCAKISKMIFVEIGVHSVEKLLELLHTTDKKYFWYYLGVLQFLLGIYELPPKLSAVWFWKIADKVKNDMAGGSLYLGIEEYSYNFPELALETIKAVIKRDLDNISIFIVSNMLGSIRTNAIFKNNESFMKLELFFKKSEKDNERICYYTSFWITYKRNGINISELESLLDEMKTDSEKVNEKIYYLIERCISYYSTDKELIRFATKWIKENINNITEQAQYSIVNSLRWVGWKLKDINDENLVKELNSLLPIILPIKSKNMGTWKEFETYITSLLKYNKEIFNEAFYSLIEHSTSELTEIIREDGLNFLFHTLENEEYSEFLFQLLLSDKRKIRKLGYKLTQRLGLKIPHEYRTKQLENKQLSILLYGTALYHIASEKIGEFLLTIEPLYRNAEENIKKEFVQEMIFQALNYPGACFEKWEKIEEKSEILIQVVDAAEAYFENSKMANTLPANSFCHYEIIKGEKQWRRNFSSEIQRGAMQKSIFLNLVKTTQILYGSQWSIYDNNKSINDPSPFGEMSHSFEWPRLELIDPEGMVIRRMNLNKKISELE